MEDSKNGSERDEALADLRRLTSIIMDNLEEGSRNKLMYPKEMRLLGGTAIRSIRLYLKTLEEHHGKEPDASQKFPRKPEEDQTPPGK